MSFSHLAGLNLDDDGHRFIARAFMKPAPAPQCVSCSATLTEDELNWHARVPGDGPSVRECFVCLDEGAMLKAWEAREEPTVLGGVFLF